MVFFRFISLPGVNLCPRYRAEILDCWKPNLIKIGFLSVCLSIFLTVTSTFLGNALPVDTKFDGEVRTVKAHIYSELHHSM